MFNFSKFKGVAEETADNNIVVNDFNKFEEMMEVAYILETRTQLIQKVAG